jgi:hypothetical protein
VNSNLVISNERLGQISTVKNMQLSQTELRACV